ncbi:hypothetical protein [Ammoniphilus sp. YIM 78166]|uniref:hypothetical protein n=1 Tax=Ammoniphilus sp. YIM 78166 TaxID=1644106 RepID=UPI001F0D4936|nr:hypothetical protein [Ammoniphilus sp. YIM 78166]
MSLLILMGIIGVFVMIILRRSILFRVGKNNKFVQILQKTKWYQNHWFGGGFLFLINAVLFAGSLLVLYLTTRLSIPFLHIIIMIGAVISSIFLWTSMNCGWQGSKENRLKMGLLGSSFFIVFALYCVYKMITLEPSFPGDDTFMAFIGLLFALIVTTVAFFTCLILVGLPNQRKMENESY